MRETLATMVTLTTYGTWLRGDARGWVDEGVVYPADPAIEGGDRRRMTQPPFRFDARRLHEIGRFIGTSLTERLGGACHALTVGTWHVHVVVGYVPVAVGKQVKCIKDAVRWGLRARRPIWSAGYDKRFCFDERSVHQRVR